MKKLFKTLIAILMVFTILPALTNVEAATTLKKPTISNGVTTWDCVWFGNYYQSNSISKEPIKWRVLSVSSTEAFLIADQCLDAKPYNKNDEDITWETCTLRSWLNGYDASKNKDKIDYRSDNFIDTAFTKEEQNAILTFSSPTDKISLLTKEDAINANYGFSTTYNVSSDTRKAKCTEYAISKGAYIEVASTKNGYWWLSSQGNNSDEAAKINYAGTGSYETVSTRDNVVRPVIRINLASSCWSYAGTVSSDGTANVVKPTQPIIISESSYTKTYGDSSFNLNAQSEGTLNYSSSNTSVVSVDENGNVTINGAGEAVITISTQATDIYDSTSQEVTVTVNPKAISKLSFNYTSFTYNGKVHYPTVKVYCGTTQLVKGVDYTTNTYTSNKKPGTYTIKATGIGNYKGSESATYKIVVKPTTLKTLTKLTKSFKVTWTKQTNTYISGYQIQYSTSSKFTSAKTVTVSSYKTTSKTIKSLKSKKKYYVRVRTYKTISGKKYYSAWSKYKTVTTK